MNKALGMQNPMVDNVVLLVSRLLLAGIFVHEGVFLAVNFAAASTAMAKVGVPAPAAIGTIALQLVASIAIAVSVATRVLGALPIFAFSVLPAMGAIMVAPNIRTAMLLAALLGAASGALGYVVAFLKTWPVGASQALVAAALAALMGVVRLALGRR